uniref:Acyl-CoA synthetase family member 2, mitochondrial-like n=1 Tax=Diabrotica virgifera virgifera TaxID=50390 RepID=A0A6P7G7S8_DIAVI
MEPGLSLLRRHSDIPLSNSTLIQLIDNSLNRFKYNTYIISKEQRLHVTYEKAVNDADNLAAGLIELGMEPKDRIGMIIHNSVESIVANFACIRGGFVAVNLNPALQPRELEHCMKITQMKCLIIVDRYKVFNILGILQKVIPEIEDTVYNPIEAKEFPHFKRVVMIDDQLHKGTCCFKSVIAMGKATAKNKLKEYQAQVKPEDLSHIIFTSGTTGNPKPVGLTHFQIYNTVIFFGMRVASDRRPTRVCFVLPQFHVFGMGFTLISLNYGNTLVLPSFYYNSESTLEAISIDHCSVIMGTPTMLADLVKYQSLKSLPIQIDECHCGGAPGSEKLFKKVIQILDVGRLADGYGATEALAISWPLRNEQIDYTSRCVGHLMDHLEAKVVDPEGRIVPFGTVGELYVRGYSVIKSYLDGENSDVFDKDGWYHTGDAIYMTDDGRLHIMGRLKDIINRGGEKVSPAEVEAILSKHDNIQEVCIVGTKDERLGEEVCACVVLEDDDIDFTLSDIRNFCSGQLSHYKIPSRLEIMTHLPKTPMGKVKKAMLVDRISHPQAKKESD